MLTIFVSTPVTIDAVVDDNICPGEIFGAIDINNLVELHHSVFYGHL